MRTTFVSWLLRVYPKAWRNEYGAEMRAMLLGRRLTAAIVIDVLRSALWQRIRAIEPATWAGIGLMLVITGAVTANIVDPLPYVWARGQTVSEQPYLAEQVRLVQRPMQSNFFVLIMAGIGFCSALGAKPRPARAAIRVWLIASIPLVALGVLILTGVVGYVELFPGQIPVPFAERGIVYVVYKAPLGIPASAPVAFLLSPLLRLPGACLWGIVGGLVGHKFAGWRRRPASA